VVAYAIAGTVMGDIAAASLGRDQAGRDVYLADLWPREAEVEALLREHLQARFFTERNRSLWDGTEHWRALSAPASVRFAWREQSTYIRRPAYTVAVPARAPEALAVQGARPLLVLGDNITTDHISPVGTIPAASAAGHWLLERGEAPADLNQYSTRRSNHEVMLRGAFTTRNLKNLLLGAANPADGARAYGADGAVLTVYEAARSYAARRIALVVFAGLNYGAGSSRDWAAKAQALLGARAVVARSFERIHRSNLIGMGVLPLLFREGESAGGLALQGSERIDFAGLDDLRVGSIVLTMRITRADGGVSESGLILNIDSTQELLYLQHGGILPYVMRKALRPAH
jgi:aconitate hydratase